MTSGEVTRVTTKELGEKCFFGKVTPKGLFIQGAKHCATINCEESSSKTWDRLVNESITVSS